MSYSVRLLAGSAQGGESASEVAAIRARQV